MEMNNKTDDIEAIRNMAIALEQAREEKKNCEDRLKEINDKIKTIEEGELSSLLDEKGISGISLDDMDISKSIIFRGGYTKHSNREAFKFLFDSANDGALKKQLIIDLNEYPRAAFELEMLNIRYEIEYSIHHATLSSILKELIEAGKFSTDDMDKYGVYAQPRIKVKKKK